MNIDNPTIKMQNMSITPKRFLCILQSFPHPHPLPQETTNLLSSLNIFLHFLEFSVNEIICTLWCQASFAEHNAFVIYPCSWVLGCIPWNRYATMPCLLIHNSWTSGLFAVWGIVNKALMNICLQVSLWSCFDLFWINT